MDGLGGRGTWKGVANWGSFPYNENIAAISKVVRLDEGTDRTLRSQLALLLRKPLFFN